MELSRNRISIGQVEFPKIVFLGIVVRYPRVYAAQFGLTQCDLDQVKLDDFWVLGQSNNWAARFLAEGMSLKLRNLTIQIEDFVESSNYPVIFISNAKYCRSTSRESFRSDD